ALQKLVQKLIQSGHIESAHDCAECGLAVALAESSFTSNVGVRVDLSSSGQPLPMVLFAETASRVVISCDPKNSALIEKMAVESGVSATRLGPTQTETFEISLDGNQAVHASVSQLKAVWGSALEKALHADTPEHLVPEVLQKS